MGYMSLFWCHGLPVRKRRALVPPMLRERKSLLESSSKGAPFIVHHGVLGDDVWRIIDSFLHPCDSVSLAMSCAYLLWLLGNESGVHSEPKLCSDIEAALLAICPLQGDRVLELEGERHRGSDPELYFGRMTSAEKGWWYRGEGARFDFAHWGVEFHDDKKTIEIYVHNKVYDLSLQLNYLARELYNKGHSLKGNVFWMGDECTDFGVVEIRHNRTFVRTWSRTLNGFGNLSFAHLVPGWIPFSKEVHQAFLSSSVNRLAFLRRFADDFLFEGDDGEMLWGHADCFASLRQAFDDDEATLELVRAAQEEALKLSEFELNFPGAAWRTSFEGRDVCEEALMRREHFTLPTYETLCTKDKVHYALEVSNWVQYSVGLERQGDFWAAPSRHAGLRVWCFLSYDDLDSFTDGA